MAHVCSSLCGGSSRVFRVGSVLRLLERRPRVKGVGSSITQDRVCGSMWL